jgi:hypothetical protein
MLSRYLQIVSHGFKFNAWQGGSVPSLTLLASYNGQEKTQELTGFKAQEVARLLYVEESRKHPLPAP